MDIISDIVNSAEKRIKTTMIGSLSKMENAFGNLWGHFSDGPLTEQEEHYADLWDFARNQILNQGNQQIRHLKEDIGKIIGRKKTSVTHNYRFTQTEDIQERDPQ